MLSAVRVGERLWAYAVMGGIALAVLWPLSWNPRTGDSFPLSPYAMFSRGQETTRVTLDYAVAVTAAGDRRTVPPQMMGTPEVMQARALVQRSIGRPAAARALCRRIADAAGDTWSDVTEIVLVTGTHDAVRVLEGDWSHGVERERVRCRVEAPR